MSKTGSKASKERKMVTKKRSALPDHASSTVTSKDNVHVPTITEHDLLAFQLFHFGDDTKPNTWFVQEEVAISYDPVCEFDNYDIDDELGFYEDGVKRTVTDEQIEMFRHSEIEQLRREALLAQEESKSPTEVQISGKDNISMATISPASSIEEELASVAPLNPPVPPAKVLAKHRSPSTHSDASQNSATLRRRRQKEVPYDQRNKRKWENYIEDHDLEHGSRTHRRIVRELDEQRTENVELEY